MLSNTRPRVFLGLCLLVILLSAHPTKSVQTPIPHGEYPGRNVDAESTARALVNAFDETLQMAARNSELTQTRQLSEATTTFLGTLGTALGPIIGAIIGPLLTNIGENLSAGTGGAPIFISSTESTSTTNGGGFPQQFGPPQQFGRPQQFGPPQQFGSPAEQSGNLNQAINTAPLVTRPRPPNRPTLSSAFLSAAGASLQHQLFGHGGIFGQGGFLGPTENIRPPPMGGDGFGFAPPPMGGNGFEPNPPFDGNGFGGNLEAVTDFNNAGGNFVASGSVDASIEPNNGPRQQFQTAGVNGNMEVLGNTGDNVGQLLYTEVPGNSNGPQNNGDYNPPNNYGTPSVPNNYGNQPVPNNYGAGSKPNNNYGAPHAPSNYGGNKPNYGGNQPAPNNYGAGSKPNNNYGAPHAPSNYGGNKPNYGGNQPAPNNYGAGSKPNNNYGPQPMPTGYNKPNNYGPQPSTPTYNNYGPPSRPPSYNKPNYGPSSTSPSYNKPNNYGTQATTPTYGGKPSTYEAPPTNTNYGSKPNNYGPPSGSTAYPPTGGSNYGNNRPNNYGNQGAVVIKPNNYGTGPNNYGSGPNNYGPSSGAAAASQYAAGSTPASQYSPSHIYPAAPASGQFIPDRPVIPTYHKLQREEQTEDEVVSMGPFKNGDNHKKDTRAATPVTGESEHLSVRPLTPAARAAAIKFDGQS